MKLFGLDFETTGLDPEADVVTEVGAVLWDTDRRSPLIVENFFVYHETPNVSMEITKKTGIHQSDLENFGLSSEEGFHRMMEVMALSDAVVAHNGNLFDRPFQRNWSKRILASPSKVAERLPWIDTQVDIAYPEEITTRRLSYLAAEHGFLNPFAHRAVFDVLTMLIVLDKYDLSDILYSASQPTCLIQAVVSYDDRQLAKDNQFYWNPKLGRKGMWVKSVKAHKIPTGLPFSVKVIDEDYQG